MVNRIHVIDPNVRRRAKVAHDLCCKGQHVEIYEDFLEFAAISPHDGLILAADDCDMPGEALAEIRASRVTIPVVAYAENPTIEHVAQVMLLGVAGYLKWPFNNDELANTLGRMLEANTDRQRRENAIAAARDMVEKLTPREREVLTALVSGMSNKEIGRLLNISPRTVEIHRSKMMMRLRAQSSADAIKIGLYADLDQVDLPQRKAA